MSSLEQYLREMEASCLLSILYNGYRYINDQPALETISMDTSMANYIMSVLRTQVTIILSWGFRNPMAIENGLQFYVLAEKNLEILNLDNYIAYGLGMKDNMLRMWQLSNLGQKKHIQDLVFPNGLVWRKENDDVEPLSKNEFFFAYPAKSVTYRQKENGQTADFNDLSALAPPRGLEPRTP